MKQLLYQDYSVVVLIGFLLNAILIGGSIVLYRLWHKVQQNNRKVNAYQPIERRDVFAVLSTLLCNVFVFVLGVFCFRKDYVIVHFDKALIGVLVLELFVFILLVDLAMFVFHKIAHTKLLYKYIHAKHHQHIGVNELSLFVLSPFEALGFGLMLLFLLLLYPFHYQAVGLYLGVNLIWGTIGHFNKVPVIVSKPWAAWLGTASFHNEHHLDPQANFGFYTTIWDRLFKTYKKSSFSE